MTKDDIVAVVADLYEELGIYYLGFDVFEVCKKLHIDVIPYSKMKDNPHFYELLLKESEDGFSIINEKTNRSIIYYNDSIETDGRITFTICHEIGHICLDHLSSRSTISEKDREREATLFALVFYTPLIILSELGIRETEDLMNTLHISYDFAERTYTRLIYRLVSETFKPSSEEMRLLDNFKKNQKEHENK